MAVSDERKDFLHIYWREPDGEKRRYSTFIPLPDDLTERCRDGLSRSHPAMTVYTAEAAEQTHRDEGLRELLEWCEAKEKEEDAAKAAESGASDEALYWLAEGAAGGYSETAERIRAILSEETEG